MVLCACVGQAADAPEDRREEEPRQQRRGEDVLDVPQQHVQAGDEQRQPGDESEEDDAERHRSPDDERAAGTNTSETTIRIAIITPNVTACVATIDRATSCRGKRTFLISSPLSIIDRAADWSDTEKKSQQARPLSR